MEAAGDRFEQVADVAQGFDGAAGFGRAEAELMRQFLNDDQYYDTDDVPGSEWLQMIRDAVVLAADEAADDGGQTEAD